MICIDADCVVANLFAFQNKQIVSVRDLNKFRELFESLARDTNVFIDVCSDSICMAVDHRPDMFYWDDEKIHRRPGADPKFFTKDYVSNMFNWRIPDEVMNFFEMTCRLTT